MLARIFVLSLSIAALIACSDDGAIDMTPEADAGSTAADARPADTGSTSPAIDSGLVDSGAEVADAGDTPDSGAMSGLAFGATCTGDSQCMAGFVCRNFNQLGDVCTKMCTTSADCPAGAMGARCNRMGLCRP